MGELFRQKRIDKGLTATFVANQIGISRDALCRIEKGTREPKATVFIKLCQFYGISVNDFAV